jgi:hypothetical protein
MSQNIEPLEDLPVKNQEPTKSNPITLIALLLGAIVVIFAVAALIIAYLNYQAQVQQNIFQNIVNSL